MAKKNDNEEKGPDINPVIVKQQTESAATTKPLTAKEFFEGQAIKKRFEDLMGKNAQSFITSILQVVTNDKLLAVADPYSIYNAACTAAVMGLSINPNLGHACIVGFKDNTRGGQVFAQFQVMAKGFVQLAQRSGQFKTIHPTEIYANQFEDRDYITGEIKIKNVKGEGNIVGYLAYFKLLNGFEKHFYMDVAEMQAHASRYSASYRYKRGQWADAEKGFHDMAKKTVLKLTLSKYAPLSIEMQNAIKLDQAVINDEHGNSFNYPDNKEPDKNHEEDRIKKMIDDCKTVDELANLLEHCTTPELEGYYSERKINIQALTTN